MSIEAMRQARNAFVWNLNTDLDNIPACHQWAKLLRKNIDALDKAIADAELKWVGLMRGVRVEGDTVIITVKGGNDAARQLCGDLIKEMNGGHSAP
jgi:poly-beta-hydroxyalkanoate depolymerase